MADHENADPRLRQVENGAVGTDVTHRATDALVEAVSGGAGTEAGPHAITFQRETARNLWDEIQPLLTRHYREIAAYPDIPLKPDKERYLKLELNGNLRVYTARAGDRLIGYAVFMVDRNLHYAGSLQAVQDILYLSPAHRRGGVGCGLIRFADERLRMEGVQVVYHHVKLKHDFGVLLERMGYEQLEKVYGRRLG